MPHAGDCCGAPLKRRRGCADIDGMTACARVSPRPPVGASRRELALYVLVALASALLMLWLWTWNARHGDFGIEAAPSFVALLHGHISTFLRTAPSYGGSLLLRAPFALPASLAGGNLLLIYRLSALPCLLAIGALGVWLARDLRRAGFGVLVAAMALELCVANPITYQALQLGHPEELLGAALCVAAVLLAQRGHINWSAVALGLAIANKEWGLLAIGPVLIAAPAGRWRILAIAGAISGALLAPILLASPSLASGADNLSMSSGTSVIFHPWQVFWFFARRGDWDPQAGLFIPSGFRLPPAWLGGGAHVLIVALAAPATLLAMLRRTRAADALLLLALLMLLRCWLDRWDNVYYPVPFLFALLAWETTVARRPPLRAATATAATFLIFWYLPDHLSPDAQALSFLIPATLALALIAARVYRLRPLRLRAGAPGLIRAPAAPL
jgi:hypothetical protein